MPESKRHSYIKYDSNGFTPIDGKLPHWNPGNPNLYWGLEKVAGIDGKRYLHYPKANFYVNEDGTVRAFGLESIPIVTRGGKNYIEVMVPGADSTDTWWTGSEYYTVKNHYRFPVGDTIRYVAPIKPEPIAEEEDPPKPVIKPKPVVKSEPKPKPIPIPPDLREGLVKVVEGKPYYELSGDPVEIAEIIRSIVEGGGIEESKPVIYEDVPPSPPPPPPSSGGEGEQTNSLLNPSVIHPIKKQHSISQEKGVTYVNPDYEGVYMYRYPHRDVHIYQISPELAHLVRQRIGNSSDRTDYKYSSVQLRNLPNGELNDTTYHDIFRAHPSESEWIEWWDGNDIAHSRLTQTAEASISRGYHTDADKVILMDEPWYTTNAFGVQKQTSLEIDPKTGLYFVRWPNRNSNDAGERKLYVINTKGHHHDTADMIKDVNGDLHKFYDQITYGGNNTIRTVAPLSTHMTTYPWDEVVKQQLELLQKDSSIIKRGVDTIKGLFGIKKFGGKINYLNIF